MSPTTMLIIPSEAARQSLRNELKGNVFRGVDGFFAKYFESKFWSATIQKRMHETESATIVSKLSAKFLSLTHLSALQQWLATFQSLSFTVDQASFHTQLLSKPGCPLEASIYLETYDSRAVTGSTRVFGEYHHSALSGTAEDDGDFMCFCERALQVFKAQPARRFLHAFLVYGTTLELWVFDRSGAYSSGKLDLIQRPHLLVQTLASYTMMNNEESGFNTFVRRLEPRSDSYITFNQLGKLYLRPDIIAAPGHIVGLGTTCFAASASTTGKPNIVVKFSWREDGAPAELQLLKRARERNVWGVVQLPGAQNLISVTDLRQGLHFPQPFVNRTFSCVVTTPLGRPLQKFASIQELLEVLCDIVKALRSLYVDGRILHRDIVIKNIVITSSHSADSPKGVLIDFDQALDLDHVRAVEPLVGSDGFMAIGILSGKPHTYRHDLESLFYIFLWLAIGNDREHDDACDILKGLPETSRLGGWCSMEFWEVGRAKARDMSSEGFFGGSR